MALQGHPFLPIQCTACSRAYSLDTRPLLPYWLIKMRQAHRTSVTICAHHAPVQLMQRSLLASQSALAMPQIIVEISTLHEPSEWNLLHSNLDIGHRSLTRAALDLAAIFFFFQPCQEPRNKSHSLFSGSETSCRNLLVIKCKQLLQQAWHKWQGVGQITALPGPCCHLSTHGSFHTR